jgi:glycosyltransferase involved in cell wall biosynthesis
LFVSKKISVIVPCHNEIAYISTCLDSLLKTTFPAEKVEFIVVDGYSTDGTREVLKKYSNSHPNIRVIDNPKKITPAALNLGIKNADGDLIMIASAHSSFPENYIPIMVQRLTELYADVVGGAIKTITRNSTPKSLAIVRILSTPMGVGNSMFRIGVTKPEIADTVPFGIYKREIFEIAGLYDERLVRNHDIELSKRILKSGFKIYLVPEITCSYYARETFSQLAHNSYRNGLWNILTVYITRQFSSLSLRHFIPLIFLLSVTLPIIAGYFTHSYLIFFSLFTFLVYNIFIFYTSIKLYNKETSIRYLIRGFYTLHFSYAMGSLVGLFHVNNLFKCNE